jgi:hypothetical protein
MFLDLLSLTLSSDPARMKTMRWLLLSLLVLTVRGPARAHLAAEDMAERADHFLAALDEAQRAKAQLPFGDDERKNWHFVPKDRRGLPLKEMTDGQRRMAMALLRSALSEHGFRKATNIMSLEAILRDIEGTGGRVTRNSELYYLSVFGRPGSTDAWGWRIEGHHLSINIAVVGGSAVAVTPSFFGSNPAEVRAGPRQGLRVLAEEEDRARQLMRSFDAAQRALALASSNAPADIVTGAERKVSALEPVGISYTRLSLEQQALLLKLIRAYVHRFRPELADADLRKIQKAGMDQVRFAWFGSTEKGRKHYYRVQGPTFLLEYDNTQNDANHIHTVWRDFEDDFAEDLLRRHYEQTPHR